MTTVKDLKEQLVDQTPYDSNWTVKLIQNEDNLTWLISHKGAQEAIVVDPMREDLETLKSLTADLKGYHFLAVIDTHTHADHVSCAADLANHLGVPLLMHQLSPTKRAHLRVSLDTKLFSRAATFKILVTPGHTPDSLTPVWGPFILGGDTLLFNDTGRDDLPGGDPEAHYNSLQKIKAECRPDMILLTNHDGKGRASSWKHQLENNSALKQTREEFMADGGAYVGNSPKLLKESLYFNFK